MEIIVVLGCAPNNCKLSNENIGRLDTALEVYNNKLKNKSNALFILSGGFTIKSGKSGPIAIKSEAELMNEYLLANGIQENQIIMELKSRNTIENIGYTTEIIKNLLNTGLKIKSITYVSSDYHIERIVKILELLGIQNYIQEDEQIEIFASGSHIFPSERTEKEKKLLADLNLYIQQYISK